MAHDFGVTLDIMTAVETPDDDAIARVRLGQAERKANAAGVDCETIVRHGKNPVEQVVAAAKAADSTK